MKAGHPRRQWRGLTVLALVISAVNCASSRTPHASGGTERWLISGRSLHLALHLDPSLGGILDDPSTYMTGDHFQQTYRLPSLRSVRTVATYTSFATFRAEVDGGGPAPGIRSVMYDPEGWHFTPRKEREAPVEYMARFSRLARSHGYEVILAPSPDLTDVPEGECHRSPGESRTGAYLRCEIPRKAGRYADLLDVQAQRLEREPVRYRSFVEAAAEQAREANPAVQVIAQLSTAPEDRPVTAAAMRRAYTAVAGVASGFYVHIDPNDVSAAATFFRSVLGQRASTAVCCSA